MPACSGICEICRCNSRYAFLQTHRADRYWRHSSREEAQCRGVNNAELRTENTLHVRAMAACRYARFPETLSSLARVFLIRSVNWLPHDCVQYGLLRLLASP